MKVPALTSTTSLPISAAAVRDVIYPAADRYHRYLYCDTCSFRRIYEKCVKEHACSVSPGCEGTMRPDFDTMADVTIYDVVDEVMAAMTTVHFTRDGHTSHVVFSYDVRAVEIIKSIPGRRYDPRRKRWTIDVTTVRLAVERFTDAGFTVTADKASHATTSPNTNAIGALFDVLPEQLRTDAYKSLARVLHPDVGGDTQLMQQLNDAYEGRHQ